MVTRAIPAAKDPEYEIKKEGAARRLMSVKNCTKHSPLLGKFGKVLWYQYIHSYYANPNCIL